MNLFEELESLKEQVNLYAKKHQEQEEELSEMTGEYLKSLQAGQALIQENKWLWQQVETQQNLIGKYLSVIKRLKQLLLLPN
ncbi:hypothetical protein [Siphonobacter sp. SORGH_AS_1065]|uniref:hypothetical protein n=1 Tax=Siphonobacter sp. SORGH_AS_1065 TaxID=3041795 RepID=UPI002782A9F7|nr:hypothetical protein [Siphonobacter sp. SORGH_AS_1065]MDQ1085686.1 hypothetical protein [Siphonobacter sp. SORGH_AS_1065]